MSAHQLAEITSEDEFAALAPVWNAAAAASRGASVFLSHEWFRAAWTWRRSDASLSLLTAGSLRDGVAILPLIRPATRRLQSRRLELLTVPDTQFADMIVADSAAEAAARTFAAALRARVDWDVTHLDYLSVDSAVLRYLVPSLRDQGLAVCVTDQGLNPCISLDGRWKHYYDDRSRRLKKSVNLAGNRLDRSGSPRVEWIAGAAVDAAALERALADVIDLSKRSWKSGTGTTLDQPGPGAFIRTLSGLARDRGWLSIWLLYHDGRPIASEYQLMHGGNVYALRADFDPMLGHVSPGTNLFRRMLEPLFGRGLSRYYLGPGNNAYKRHWAEDGEQLQCTVVYNRTSRGQAERLKDLVIKPALRALRDRVRPERCKPADGQGRES